MIKLHKILLRAIGIIAAIGIVLFAAFAVYLENSINSVMTEEQQEPLFKAIEKTPPLPENFIATTEKYFPDYFRKTVWDEIFERMLGDNSTQCQCAEIYIFPFGPRYTIFTQYIVTLEIEERFSNRKCYEFNMKEAVFGHQTKTVYEASCLFYDKELEELNEREIVELNIIPMASTYFSPIINPS